MKMKFEELKPQELKEIIETTGIVYLPLGTLEWHERHLPLGLDALVAYELCIKSCEKTGGCVVPPFYFGTDREHSINGKIMHGIDAKVGKIMTGSVYFLESELFLNLLKKVASNLSDQGFKKLVIVSGHSGTAQNIVLEELEKEQFGNMKLFILAGKKFAGGVDHAAEKETRLMMAVNNLLVNLESLREPYEGVLGDSALNATKEAGEKQFNSIVEQIVEMVR
jgi:creatinine amidohydrolase